MSMNQANECIDSPCVRNCCLDNNNICLGCFRSLEEIKDWMRVDAQTRQRFLENAKYRAIDYQQKMTRFIT